jgi:two-component system, NtrC family, response regulator
MTATHLDDVSVVTTIITSAVPDDYFVSELQQFGPIRTASQNMIDTIESAALFAKSDISILLHGESGTGKELFAEYIHRQSTRASKRLVTVNAAALPESLAEALLFGYEKGAFTGATGNKEGLIEAAHGGTLFLDEVGDLPLSIQTKLLRVVQNKVVLRVGSTLERKVDVRFVFASHRAISDMVEQGTFREDLFYRIQETLLDIAPLRTRGEDAVYLARSFANRFSREMKIDDAALANDAESAIRAHTWPGNVRELISTVRRAVIVARGEQITAKHLQIAPPRLPGAPSGRLPSRESATPASLTSPIVSVPQPSTPAASQMPVNFSRESMVEMRRNGDVQRVMSALEAVQGNVSKAAELLGVSRPTIYNILRRAQTVQSAAA